MNNRKLCAFLILVTMVFVSGCACKGDMIRVDAVEDLIGIVSERHDKLVEATDTMSDIDKVVALQSTELLQRVVEEAKNEEPEPVPTE